MTKSNWRSPRLMFAAAPWIINAAPYESTMGLVQKIFYFHMPSAWLFLIAAIVAGVASAIFLFGKKQNADGWALAAAELAVLFGVITLVTGPLWARKAWGVWWVWDARLTSSLMLWMIFVAYLLLRRYGGPGSDKLGAGMALFGMANVPFIYVSVNVLAHAPSADLGRADAARADGRSAVVLRVCASCCCSWSCSACGRGSSTSVRVSKPSTSPRTKRDAILSSVVCCRPAAVRARRLRGAAQALRGRVRADGGSPRAEQIPAINLVAAAYGFVWVVVLGYVWSLGRRLQKVEAEIADLERRAARWTSACRRPRTSSTSRSCC